ncbi:MAG: T9SS type A sorting domain-containing protein [Bacteroidota bacterium]
MKTKLILLLYMVATGGFLFAQIPNNGFETWTTTAGYLNPDGWGTMNPMTQASGIYTCQRGTPGNPGSYYIKLISKNFPGSGVLPGIAVSGKLITTTTQSSSGFPYTNRPDSLTGNWQYMAYLSDQGLVAVFLTRWNESLVKRDTVAQVVYLLPGMVMSWHRFSIPITYNSASIPDSAMIVLSASGANPVEGSFLYIDDLLFKGGNAGIEEMSKQEGIRVFPDPATGNLINIDIKSPGATASITEIIDTKGNTLLRSDVNRLHLPFTVDISALPAGEYFVRVHSTAGMLVSRFARK